MSRERFYSIIDFVLFAIFLLWLTIFYGGRRCGVIHFTNIVLHVISTALVFILSNQLLQKFFSTTKKRTIAVITALLFFAYPFHSEAVFWLLGRSAVIGTIFSLLFFIFYLKKTAKSIILSYLFFALALLSYESCWVLPLFCWILFIAERKEVKTFIQPVVLSALFFVYLYLRYFFTNEVIGDYEGANFIHLNIPALGINFIKLVTRSFFPPFASSLLMFCFSVILLVLIALFFKQKKQERIKVLLLFIFFLASLAPYASIGIDVYGTEAERFLYFPSVILCFIVSYVVCTASFSIVVKNAFLIFVFLSYCITLFQNAVNYRFAGNVVKTFINEVNHLHDINILYIEQLPHSENGALILRQGAIESVKWLAKPDAVDSVIICSEREELTGLKKTYKTSYKSLSNTNTNCGDLTKNDAVFYFTDSALIVYK